MSNDDKISKLRKIFLEEASEESHLYDPQDIDQLKTDDWSVERYLLHCKGNIESALPMLRESMRWRKSFGVNNLKETDFPKEYYLSGSFFTYLPDRKGNAMVYIRGKLHRKIAEWSEIHKKFFVFIINKLDKEMGGHRYAAFWDCEGAGLANVDTEMLSFMVTTISSYFPYGLEYVLLHELPWVLNAIYHLAKSWVPEHYQRLAVFANRSNITDYIAPENLPDYLNGTCTVNYRNVPEGVPTARECELRYQLLENSAYKLETYLENYCLES
ncbi:motile sperm domain-containing protein 2 [Tetranychus urticae]|uniref:CRAL-TRIO domain-containing protein n=1 Tax=Tetranychus urticae TaxID=32264 RepID=T1K0R7_TETUR|nr:motile sperm domain-containing protein 2 [Tetranychus urticae]